MDTLTLTPETLAQQLHISRQQLYVWIDEGKVPQGFHIGRMRRWYWGEIEDWIKRGCPSLRVLTEQKRQEERSAL